MANVAAGKSTENYLSVNLLTNVVSRGAPALLARRVFATATGTGDMLTKSKTMIEKKPDFRQRTMSLLRKAWFSRGRLSRTLSASLALTLATAAQAFAQPPDSA